jgi:hypothetical protein
MSVERLPEGEEPAPLREVEARWARAAYETSTLLAEHRHTRPLRHRESRQARIDKLLEALSALDVDPIEESIGPLLHARNVLVELGEDAPPWAIWPLLALAGRAGQFAWMEQILSRLTRADWIVPAADALCTLPEADIVPMARRLLKSKPLPRAAATHYLSTLGPLEQALFELEGPDALLLAELHAWSRAEGPSADRTVARVESLLKHPTSDVALEAARALMLNGSRTPLNQLRGGDGLLNALGPSALELLALAGTPEDLSWVETLTGTAQLSHSALLALGRFGHPQTWKLLVHHLYDEATEDAAATALELIFGALVDRTERTVPSAWQEALTALDLDPAVRLCVGEPWTPSRSIARCLSGDATSLECEARLNELTARLGAPFDANLSSWSPWRASLSAAQSKAASCDSSAGTWPHPKGAVR